MPTSSTKSIFTSKTIGGIVLLAISFISMLAAKKGHVVSETIQSDAVNTILAFGGAMLALWGRVVADKPLSLTGGPKTILLALLAASLAGCNLLPANATDQQRLDNAKQVYTNANNVVSILIATGYLAKNDQALKDAIFRTSTQIKAALDSAQTFLATGNKLSFQFWFDQAMNTLATFLQFQAEGEAKHKASNPATRPALPAKVTANNGSPDCWTCDRDRRAVGSRGAGRQSPWRYAYG